MTCIIGLIDKDAVFMGGDRCESDGWSQRTLAIPKVFNLNGEFILGVSGKARAVTLLRFGFKPPRQKEKQGDYEFISTDFAEAIRKRFKDGGIAEVKDNKEEVGASILIAYKGKLYKMDNLFYMQLVELGYEAAGGGKECAMGSLYSSKEADPSKKILAALKAAEYFCMGVRGPFDIKSMKFDDKKPSMVRPVKKGK